MNKRNISQKLVDLTCGKAVRSMDFNSTSPPPSPELALFAERSTFGRNKLSQRKGCYTVTIEMSHMQFALSCVVVRSQIVETTYVLFSGSEPTDY